VSALPACCTDFDIRADHLIFPERMNAEGQAFVETHGIDLVSLLELRAGAEDAGEMDGVPLIKIKHRCQHLLDDGSCDIYAERPAICRKFDCRTRKDCACGGKGRIE
jgi:Fe-S-cluster containining protein